MSESMIKFGIDASGASVEANGGNADRIVNSILDLISPFSEFAGQLGDRIRDGRRRRQANIERILIAANQSAEQGNLLLHPKPIGLLERWVEGASNSDDDYFTEKWGNLLFSNGTPTMQILFMEYLAKLGGAEARWVSQLWELYKMDAPLHELKALKLRNLRAEIHKCYGKEVLEEPLDSMTPDLVQREIDQGIIIRSIQYDAVTDWSDDPELRKKRMITHSWEPETLFPTALTAIGILEETSITEVRKFEGGETGVSISCYLFSRMGSEFMKTIASPPTNNIAADDASG